jgi:hypothetical protein
VCVEWRAFVPTEKERGREKEDEKGEVGWKKIRNS